MSPHPPKKIKARSRIPAFVKVPKFCTSKDIEKILKIREADPRHLWADIIVEVIESKFE